MDWSLLPLALRERLTRAALSPPRLTPDERAALVLDRWSTLLARLDDNAPAAAHTS